MELIVAAMVLLHGPDGHAILVNPDAVASMYGAVKGQKNKNITEQAQCLINTSDGKFISVIETCEEVRKLLGKQKEDK